MDVDSLRAVSAILVAESAPHKDSLIMIADNIPLIADLNALRLIVAANTAFPSLLSQLQTSLLDVQADPSDVHFTEAITLVRSVTYVAPTNPNATKQGLQGFFEELRVRGGWYALGSAPTELLILRVCVRNLYKLSANVYMPHLHNSRGKLWLQMHNPRTADSVAKLLKSIRIDSAVDTWLRHFIIIASYNRWDMGRAGALIDDISTISLYEGLQVDAPYLSKVSDALLVILGWFSRWGHRHSEPSRIDITDLRDAWSITIGSRSRADHLPDVLLAFANHYEREDSDTYTFLRCQWCLLKQVNALYPIYDGFLEEPLLQSPRISPIKRMHSSFGLEPRTSPRHRRVHGSC
ncbi:hypothetical protein FRB94_009479 [Tulasnella sp. JGI-2019a]|nr:hypothetical protein FRB94_009479 [Tulasnella sp. JGI-2019a]